MSSDARVTSPGGSEGQASSDGSKPRPKRKMTKEEEEAANLHKANQQLREELESLRSRVEELREQRGEGLEEFDEEAELLSLENELLRAQLLEQQEFLRGCRILAEQLALEAQLGDAIHSGNQPLRLVPEMISTDGKRELMRQGADNALTHLFHLVSRSQQEGAWTAVKLPEHVFRTAVPGLNVTCCYRKERAMNDPTKTTLCMRVDGCFPNISPEVTAQGYWSTWTSAESWATAFQSFFESKSDEEEKVTKTTREEEGNDTKLDETIVQGKTPIPFSLRELMSAREADGSEVRVNLYREMPHDNQPRDWVYVMTRLQRDIAMSTLSLAPELTPGVAARREQHSRRVVQQTEKPKRKRAKATGSASAAQLIGRQKCWVLARNSMRSINATDMKDINSTRVDPENRLVEGLFVWQDYVSIDVEVPCDEGKEIRRQRVPAARAAAYIALTDDLFPVQETDLHNAVVDASGRATEKYAKLIDMFYSIMTLGGIMSNTPIQF